MVVELLWREKKDLFSWLMISDFILDMYLNCHYLLKFGFWIWYNRFLIFGIVRTSTVRHVLFVIFNCVYRGSVTPEIDCTFHGIFQEVHNFLRRSRSSNKFRKTYLNMFCRKFSHFKNNCLKHPIVSFKGNVNKFALEGRKKLIQTLKSTNYNQPHFNVSQLNFYSRRAPSLLRNSQLIETLLWENSVEKLS